ncbi:MAG: response regulator [Gammaproteobacteria bacterium]|nr:response regulator [Gammaproteobacteria bacterium]MCW8986825.1 response regulator [Gammaproteobacteria bacterium]
MAGQAVPKRHILVVDDDELVSEYLGALLEAESYDVVVLNEPVAALNYFKEHPDDFDLIITDQVMPGLTGVEISRAILELRPSMPILLITGYSEKITAENAKSFGLRGFFSKPINEDLFLNEINHLVSTEQMATAH